MIAAVVQLRNPIAQNPTVDSDETQFPGVENDCIRSLKSYLRKAPNIEAIVTLIFKSLCLLVHELSIDKPLLPDVTLATRMTQTGNTKINLIGILETSRQ